MGTQETIITKHMHTFCKFVPVFVNKWTETILETLPIVRGVVNMSEQLRMVNEADISYIENFEDNQDRLKFKIITAIEEDILPIKLSMTKLNKLNQDIRNKLLLLENSTHELDWENEELDIIRGSATVPRLNRLLQASLSFWIFFQKATKNINACVKWMDLYDEKKMTELEKAFNVNLNDESVTYLVAITQYVDNAKAIK